MGYCERPCFKFFQYVLIDNKGRIIYQDEDGDLDKLNKYIR